MDVPRRHVLVVADEAAIARREASIVTGAHHAHLTIDPSLLPFETEGLPVIEAAGAYAVGNALMLVKRALANGGFLHGRRRGLCDGDGGRCCQGRHKDKLQESHGASPSVTEVAELRFLTLTSRYDTTLEDRLCASCEIRRFAEKAAKYAGFRAIGGLIS
jgi:hypothetical protein